MTDTKKLTVRNKLTNLVFDYCSSLTESEFNQIKDTNFQSKIFESKNPLTKLKEYFLVDNSNIEELERDILGYVFDEVINWKDVLDYVDNVHNK